MIRFGSAPQYASRRLASKYLLHRKNRNRLLPRQISTNRTVTIAHTRLFFNPLRILRKLSQCIDRLITSIEIRRQSIWFWKETEAKFAILVQLGGFVSSVSPFGVNIEKLRLDSLE
jgi:hypothetical protein